MDVQRAYDDLLGRAKQQSLMASCSSILSWDEQTNMPSGGASHRSNQMALLAGLQHERATDPRVGELLAIAEGSDLAAQADSVAAVNVRELRRRYDRLVRLPRALVEELAQTTSLAHAEWVTARSSSDFERFRPWLDKIVQLKRQEAACLAKAIVAPIGDAPGRRRPARGLERQVP